MSNYKPVELGELLIPKKELGADNYRFSPSKIVGLEDYTNRPLREAFTRPSNLADVDYKNVETVNICIEGMIAGYNSKTLKREDFEKLKKGQWVETNEEMIGQPITAVYQHDMLIGFLPEYTNYEDLKRSRLEQELQELNSA